MKPGLRRILLATGILLALGAALAYSGANLSLADAGCEWEQLVIDGQTFKTLDELKAAAKQQGTSLGELRQDFSFRERAGTVQVRADSCGMTEVTA